MIKTSQSQLIEALRGLEFPKNHIYLIHSSLLSFGIFEAGPNGIMKCLYEVLGTDATILMPAFTTSFGETRHWDYHTSKAETGALTEYFRKLPGVQRTVHPFHSLSAVGPKAKDFLSCQNLSSFGPGSPFEQLYEKEAFNIALGIGLVGGATFLHHAEEMAKVPYRLYKDFPGEVIAEDGTKRENIYKMFVREIGDTYEYCNEWSHVLGDFLKDNLVVEGSVNGAPLLVFPIKPAHDRFVQRIKDNPLYCAKKVMR